MIYECHTFFTPLFLPHHHHVCIYIYIYTYIYIYIYTHLYYSTRMIDIQNQMTERALELLNLPDDVPCLLLDVG